MNKPIRRSRYSTFLLAFPHHYSLPQAAAVLGVHKNSVRRMFARGELSRLQVNSETVLVPRGEVDAMARAAGVNARERGRRLKEVEYAHQ